MIGVGLNCVNTISESEISKRRISAQTTEPAGMRWY